MIAAPSFRYDDAAHAYYLDDQRIPGISELLKLGGLVDDRFYTEESRKRGSEVHELCAQWDLQALDPLTVTSNRRPYLLGYIDAVTRLECEWEAVEEAEAHPSLRFGGRPDRIGIVRKLQTVAEIKTGKKAKMVEVYGHRTNAHAVQLCLQAILAASRRPLPAKHWQRLAIHPKVTGKFDVELYEDERDFDVARKILRDYAC